VETPHSPASKEIGRPEAFEHPQFVLTLISGSTGVYGQDSGRTNGDPRNGSAGGEVRPDAMGPRTNLVGDSPVR
jgi:hypothetical protein